MDRVLEPVIEQIRSLGLPVEPHLVLYSAVAVFVSILLLVLLGLRRGPKARGNTVLLLGACNSGKTSLFLRLTEGSPGCRNETHTSMKENEATFEHYDGKRKATIHLVDFPGHQRLRPQLETFLPAARVIVFLVDSFDFRSEVASVAQYMYDLLVHRVVNAQKIPILVACNKNEMATAKDSEYITHELENELNQIRKNQGTMGDIDGKNDNIHLRLGVKGKDFKFSQLTIPITFVECSVKEGDTKPIEDFIRKYIR